MAPVFNSTYYMRNKPKTPVPMLEWVWVTRTKEKYKLKDMARSHVQNSLQWCMRNKPSELTWHVPARVARQLYQKDGHTYDEWIVAFTVRLLDPNCI